MMPNAKEEAQELRRMVQIENKHGARLRITLNLRKPQEGPLFVTGTDRKGRRTRLVGDEEFLLKMLIRINEPWPAPSAT